jgi:hypothetical protein
MEARVVFWIVVCAVVAIGIAVWRYLQERLPQVRREELERAEQAQMEQQQLAEEVARGKRLPDGSLACMICNTARATHVPPIIGVSFFERLNPLRELYGTGRMYRRQQGDAFQEPTLCEAHHDLYASVLDSELASLRNACAAFGSEIDRRIAGLRGGMVMAETQREYQASMKQQPASAIRASFASLLPPAPVPTTQPSATPAISDADFVVVSAATTNGKPPSDEVTN